MKDKEAAIDTSVLAVYSGIGRIDLILAAYPEVHVVPAVYDEIVTKGEGWLEASTAQSAIFEERFRIVKTIQCPVDPRLVSLGSGEREVVAWALNRRITALIDDTQARKLAKQAGVSEIVGSLGILGRVKFLGMIDKAAPILVQMRANGIRFGDDLVKRFLMEIDES
ncbi:MAG: DUF3368 domain-containing protein [Opitutales bacterium]